MNGYHRSTLRRHEALAYIAMVFWESQNYKGMSTIESAGQIDNTKSMHDLSKPTPLRFRSAVTPFKQTIGDLWVCFLP
jgi:hypothetical protein